MHRSQFSINKNRVRSLRTTFRSVCDMIKKSLAKADEGGKSLKQISRGQPKNKGHDK